MKIFLSIDIASPPERVFGWLESPEKAMQWMTSVARTEILHETPERVGTTFREIVEENGNGMELRGMITGFESDQSISFHLTSRVNELDVEYAVETIPTGTRLTQNANVRWKFPVNVMSIFMGKKMRQGISAQSQKEFEKLKELCESGAGK
ncbi:MAG: hypothetical protein DYG86_13205 [Chloroflexi bacterium CFX2]|nr:hypothetical protein [Chloroflexi bacterium CFX2]